MNTATQVCAENPIPTTSATVACATPPERKRILLADDSPQIRESLSKVLRNAGYHVTSVAHGGQALDRALEEEFDLLLLDLNMPGMDGWEALDHLASLKPALPVIIITAQPDQRDWAQAEGARALMEKPLDLPLLLQTIHNFTTQSPGNVASNQKEPSVPFRLAAPEKKKFRFSDPHRGWKSS